MWHIQTIEICRTLISKNAPDRNSLACVCFGNNNILHYHFAYHYHLLLVSVSVSGLMILMIIQSRMHTLRGLLNSLHCIEPTWSEKLSFGVRDTVSKGLIFRWYPFSSWAFSFAYSPRTSPSEDDSSSSFTWWCWWMDLELEYECCSRPCLPELPTLSDVEVVVALRNCGILT